MAIGLTGEPVPMIGKSATATTKSHRSRLHSNKLKRAKVSDCRLLANNC